MQSFGNLFGQATIPPPPVQNPHYPALDMTRPYVMYGSKDNQQAVFQNRLFYVPGPRGGGRVLTPEDLAGDHYDFIDNGNPGLRQAVAGDMAKPRADMVPVPPPAYQTPEQRLDTLDRLLQASQPNFVEHRAAGVVSRVMQH